MITWLVDYTESYLHHAPEFVLLKDTLPIRPHSLLQRINIICVKYIHLVQYMLSVSIKMHHLVPAVWFGLPYQCQFVLILFFFLSHKPKTNKNHSNPYLLLNHMFTRQLSSICQSWISQKPMTLLHTALLLHHSLCLFQDPALTQLLCICSNLLWIQDITLIPVLIEEERNEIVAIRLRPVAIRSRPVAIK